MNMKKEAKRIYDSGISHEEKKRLLMEVIDDCLIEMDADDQNMHPEIEHEIAEGYKAAKMYLADLQVT